MISARARWAVRRKVEPWQFIALPDEFLDPDINEIHKVILGLRGLAHHGLEELLGRVIVRVDGQMAPDRHHDAACRRHHRLWTSGDDTTVPTCVAIWSTMDRGTVWTGTK